jgi:hypothetical protein
MTDDIFEAIKNHNIVIKVPGVGRRLAVELFPYKDGAVFFDVGWTESSGHPYHVLPGPIEDGGDSQWSFGDFDKRDKGKFYVAHVFDPKVFPELVGNNDTWERYLQHEDEGQMSIRGFYH